MESQPQYPEFRNNPENFHPCISSGSALYAKIKKKQTEVYLKKF